MEPSSTQAALVAVDLGAQSCRVSLLRWNEDVPQIQVMHRFANGPVVGENGLRWNIDGILDGIQAGLLLCAQAATEGITSIAVDGWAVDYVRLGPDGEHLGDPFCYRDERTSVAQAEVHQRISPARLYALTGIQLLGLNTLYQLRADNQSAIPQATPWLNLPEFVTFRLGGNPVAEYTNATHTQLVKVGTHEWCEEIFQAAELISRAAPKIVSPGALVGSLRGELAAIPAFRKTKLIVPACHDTASAIAAIPADGADCAFISSGTWSLVGTLLHAPCVTEEARKFNFTNLGGVGGSFCFLKNVNGMWLLRQCMEQWEAQGFFWSMNDLVECCQSLPRPDSLIDVDDPPLMLPGNMPGKINTQLIALGKKPFRADSHSVPLIAILIFHSLAARYAEVLASISVITGKKLKRLFIVGGGSKNALLNRLTAQCTGLEVIAGPVESATLGNFAIQMAALNGEWNEKTGVCAHAVARNMEKVSTGALEFSMDRQTN